jgi:predicted nucleic acid-binding Zn ribbon protein
MPLYPAVCLNCGETIDILCKNKEIQTVTRNLMCEKCNGTAFKVKLAPFVINFNYTRNKK